MSDGYKSVSMLLAGAAQAVAQSQTNQAVTKSFMMSSEDSLFFLAKIKTSSTTVAAAITAKLQESYDGSTWEDVGSPANVSITGDGTFEISLNNGVAADAAVLPTWQHCRVVVTTGAGDSVTIDNVWVSRRM